MTCDARTTCLRLELLKWPLEFFTRWVFLHTHRAIGVFAAGRESAPSYPGKG